MILSDISIARYISDRKIQIYPRFETTNIRPTGVRVHLDNEILIPVEGQVIDLVNSSRISYKSGTIGHDGYLLQSDDFILASTTESIQTVKDIICHIEGRSTLARIGLMVHCSSGIIDNIHDEPRAVTLELKNIGKFNLLLRPGIPIAMLVFSELSAEIQQDSQSQYRGQRKVMPPNLSYKPLDEYTDAKD